MATNLTPDQRAARRASRQYGLLTRADALACGLTRDQIKARLASGRWIRLASGVYLVAGSPVTWRTNALAACLAGPPGTVASHVTAAALFGLASPSVLPHVTVPRATSGRLRLAVVHRSAVPKIDRVTVEGIPCTSPARTLCDCATLLGFGPLADVVDSALARRLVRVDAVVAALGRTSRRPGRRGTALLHDVLDVWSGPVELGSVPEARLLRRLRTWGYPEPVPQFEVYDDAGRLLAVFDFAWPDPRVGLEYDGEEAHSPRTWAKEEVRDARLEALGWHIERVGKSDLLTGSTRLRERLDTALRPPAPGASPAVPPVPSPADRHRRPRAVA